MQEKHGFTLVFDAIKRSYLDEELSPLDAGYWIHVSRASQACCVASVDSPGSAINLTVNGEPRAPFPGELGQTDCRGYSAAEINDPMDPCSNYRYQDTDSNREDISFDLSAFLRTRNQYICTYSPGLGVAYPKGSTMVSCGAHTVCDSLHNVQRLADAAGDFAGFSGQGKMLIRKAKYGFSNFTVLLFAAGALDWGKVASCFVSPLRGQFLSYLGCLVLFCISGYVWRYGSRLLAATLGVLCP